MLNLLLIIFGLLFSNVAWAQNVCGSSLNGYGRLDPQRVDEFLHEFKKPTWKSGEERQQELDRRIVDARLEIAEKAEIIKKLAPRADLTGDREEVRMERILLSVDPQYLPVFKFALDYDGDYKDIAEYVFHDIDHEDRQDRIIEHFGKARRGVGVKVLSDVDDTMYANLVDERYPKKSLYPGVVEFYDSLKREPFALQKIPLTTLSARPNPVGGILEEDSLKSLAKIAEGRLCFTALSGELISSGAGTLETWLRANVSMLNKKVPHGHEDKIGEVKYENFAMYSQVYPEYHYVFVGDSGQADALTAEKMITDKSEDRKARIITTFIHDLRQSNEDEKSASRAFRNLSGNVRISDESETGRGVIVFRNYIDAAVVAYKHSTTLRDLVTVEELARITKAALVQFQKIGFQGKEAAKERLQEQYRQDAEAAYNLLTKKPIRSSTLEEHIAVISRTLDEAF